MASDARSTVSDEGSPGDRPAALDEARSKLNTYDSAAEATAIHLEEGLDPSEAPEDVMGYGHSDR